MLEDLPTTINQRLSERFQRIFDMTKSLSKGYKVSGLVTACNNLQIVTKLNPYQVISWYKIISPHCYQLITVIKIWIPRVFSEPVPVHIDPIWKQLSPIILPQTPLPAYHSWVPRSLNGRLSSKMAMGSFHSSDHGSAQGSIHSPMYSPPSLHIFIPPFTNPSPSLASKSHNNHYNRTWFMKLLMIPYHCVEWMINQWGKLSKDCMDCVKVTYWIVLIVGGIVSTVMVLAPFL